MEWPTFQPLVVMVEVENSRWRTTGFICNGHLIVRGKSYPLLPARAGRKKWQTDIFRNGKNGYRFTVYRELSRDFIGLAEWGGQLDPDPNQRNGFQITEGMLARKRKPKAFIQRRVPAPDDGPVQH